MTLSCVRAVRLAHEFLEAVTSCFGSKTYSLPGVVLRLPRAIESYLYKRDLARVQKKLFCSEGYHRFHHQNLTASEVTQYMHYAASSCAVHANHTEWVEPLGFRPVDVPDFGGGLDKHGVTWFDKETGLKVILYQNNEELIVTFGALHSHHSEFSQERKQEQDALTRSVRNRAILSLLGHRPNMYEKAEYFVQKLIESNQFADKKITLCGMCLGGSIASYTALRLKQRAVCMNTFPLGPGLQKKIGNKNLRHADEYVTHISSKRDYFSNFGLPLAIPDLFFNTLGLKTPGNFGKRLDVQAIHKNLVSNHQDILGAMLATCHPEHKELCIRAGKKAGFEERQKIRHMLKTL